MLVDPLIDARVERRDASTERHGLRAYDPRMPWDAQRRAEPRLLGLQFLVCVGAWTAIDLLLAGAVSTSGVLAAIVTGVVLVVVSWLLVKLGWDHGPSRRAA
jgi:hypothetical protein